MKTQYGKANKCENTSCFYPRYNSRNILLKAPKGFNWACISGKYIRDRKDAQMLCISCHHISDRKNIPGAAKKFKANKS